MFFGTERTSDVTSVISKTHANTSTGTETLTLLWQLDEIQFLALLGPRDMAGQEGVHESLEIGAPPLREGVANLPVLVDAFAGELRADGGQSLIQPFLEPVQLLVVVVQVVAWSEEG